MKGVIVKAEGRFAVLLGSDGGFHRIINRGYRAGQELQDGAGALPAGKLAAAAAAAAVLLTLGGGSALAYWTPARYASVDINPSVELRLNLFNRVIGAAGANEDGARLLKNIHTGPSLGQSVKAIVREAAAEGYLQPDGGNAVVITVTGSGSAGDGTDRTADQSEADARDGAQQALNDAGTPGEVVVERVGYDRVQEARKLGTTPGKLNLVQKLAASSGSTPIDVNEWLKKPVKEIMKAIQDNRKNGPSSTASAAPTDSATPPDGSAPPADATATASPAATPSPEATLHGNGKPDKAPQPTKSPKPSAADTDGPDTARPSRTPKPAKTDKPDRTVRPAATAKPTHGNGRS